MAETREQYRQKLSKVYDDTFESARESAFDSAPTRNIDGVGYVPIGLLIEIEEEAASDAAEAVAAQVLRDIAVLLVSEADDDDNVWMPWVDIDEFAKERGINLSE